MESKSLKSGKECIPVFLGSQHPLSVSPIFYHRRESTKGESGPMLNATYYTSMAKSTMVSRLLKMFCKKTYSFSLT